jgi:hypothetical protein
MQVPLPRFLEPPVTLPERVRLRPTPARRERPGDRIVTEDGRQILRRTIADRIAGGRNVETPAERHEPVSSLMRQRDATPLRRAF